MRLLDVREQSIPISRYADPSLGPAELTTSIVAVTTDVVRSGKPVIGYGYASVGRYAQGGLIRERFAPRLLEAPAGALADEAGIGLDPFRAWKVMMAGEKPGGHGERCVAVGALDMALWDAAAKIAGVPLHRLLARLLGRDKALLERVQVYAGGGYPYPSDDIARLSDEMRRFVDLGFTQAKMKIGTDLVQDLRRIEAAAACLPGSGHLAVDAMNAYDRVRGLDAARALVPFGLRWFEDICDPHDFSTQAAVAEVYGPPIAAGEALFSAAEAKLLDQHGGLSREHDVLVFDPVHCYGLPGYLRILEALSVRGWPHEAFWPHGGHLFSLHIVAALGLGGVEVTPFAFAPFSGLADGTVIFDGHADLPQAPGVGFELNAAVWATLKQAFG